jgi:hypothetical protein
MSQQQAEQRQDEFKQVKTAFVPGYRRTKQHQSHREQKKLWPCL